MGFIGLKAFPAAVVGGFGSVPGAVVGGLIIGVVEALAGFYLPEGFKDIAAYVVVLVVLLFMPSGHFRRDRSQEGLRSRCASSSRPTTTRTSACSSTAGRSSGTGCSASLLLAAPYLVSGYVLSQLHFVCIYAIVGFGLMLLVGYTGQISLGHAAFLAVGAYTEALLQAAGMPFVVSLTSAALFSAAVGIIVGLPALRLKGIYLAIATFAFNVIVEEIITRWESLDRRQQRQAAEGDRDVRLPAEQPGELLLSLPRADRAVVPRADQPAALADRPRLRGDPRLGSLGELHGHQSRPLQDHVVRALGGADRRSAARSTRTRSASSRPSSSP